MKNIQKEHMWVKSIFIINLGQSRICHKLLRRWTSTLGSFISILTLKLFNFISNSRLAIYYGINLNQFTLFLHSFPSLVMMMLIGTIETDSIKLIIDYRLHNQPPRLQCVIFVFVVLLRRMHEMYHLNISNIFLQSFQSSFSTYLYIYKHILVALINKTSCLFRSVDNLTPFGF